MILVGCESGETLEIFSMTLVSETKAAEDPRGKIVCDKEVSVPKHSDFEADCWVAQGDGNTSEGSCLKIK